MSSTMCLYCGVKPKYSGYDYCGKGCGAAAKAGGGGGGGGGSNTPSPSSNNATLCQECHQRPRYKETLRNGEVKVHPFCGRACAAKSSGRGSPTPGGNNLKPGQQLILLARNDPKYVEVFKQFDSKWLHTNKTKPTVVYIYSIIMPKPLMDSYNAYRNAVEARGNFVAQGKGMTAGNECRRWHGTKRSCTLGDDPNNLTPCGQSACSLCCILKTSFKLSFVGTAPTHLFSRFGNGIYASSTSSKSDDYSKTMGVSSPNKVVFLTKVVVGKGHKLLRDSRSLTAPPAGFDSVLGETGDSLNYDEVVVYKDEAIRPAWLVVYR